MSTVFNFKSPYWKAITITAFALLLFLAFPEIGEAATATTTQVQTKVKTGVTAFKTVLSGIVVLVGIVASLKIVVKHLPKIDDAHTKNEMWNGLGQVLLAVAAGGALIWGVPWVYSLFD